MGKCGPLSSCLPFGYLAMRKERCAIHSTYLCPTSPTQLNLLSTTMLISTLSKIVRNNTVFKDCQCHKSEPRNLLKRWPSALQTGLSLLGMSLGTRPWPTQSATCRIKMRKALPSYSHSYAPCCFSALHFKSWIGPLNRGMLNLIAKILALYNSKGHCSTIQDS